MRYLALLATLLCSSVCASAQDACTTNLNTRNIEGLSDLKDLRMNAVLERVARRSQTFGSDIPILCQFETTPLGPYPITVRWFGDGTVRYAMLLPRFIAEFDDEAVIGIMAHEIGHIKNGMLAVTANEAGIRLEISIDRRAAEWVGKRSVLLQLFILRARSLPHTPEKYRPFLSNQLERRIQALR